METINGLEKKDAMEKAFKIAYEGEANRMSCAQESFHAISSVLGVKNHQIFKSLSCHPRDRQKKILNQKYKN